MSKHLKEDRKQASVEKSMEIEKVIGYLEGLIKCFKEGEIYVQQGENALYLKPAKTMLVEVEAKQKRNKEKFSLKMEWYTEAPAAEPGEEEEDLSISPNKPEEE